MSEKTYDEMRGEILERFKKLRLEATADVKFDKATLEHSFDCTIKATKWLNKRNQWVQLLRSYELKRSECWKKAFEYYKTDYPLNIDNKEEYKLLINSDPNYVEIYQLTQLVNEIVDYIDQTIALMKDRQWEIRNFTEFLKFQNGQ